MSQIVTTADGRFKFRRVNTGYVNNPDTWLFQCPCGQWAYLDDDQWNGRVSVDHASEGCTVNFHETHPFGQYLVAAIQASILTNMPLTSEE